MHYHLCKVQDKSQSHNIIAHYKQIHIPQKQELSKRAYALFGKKKMKKKGHMPSRTLAITNKAIKPGKLPSVSRKRKEGGGVGKIQKKQAASKRVK